MSVADSLLAYSFAALLLTLTPGLDTALILRTSTVEGGKRPFRRHWVLILGVLSGARWWPSASGRCWRHRPWRMTCLNGVGPSIYAGWAFS